MNKRKGERCRYVNNQSSDKTENNQTLNSSRVSASHFSCWGAIDGWHQVSKDMHAWPAHPNQLLRHPGPQKLSEGLLPEAAIGWNDSEWSKNHSQTTTIKIKKIYNL